MEINVFYEPMALIKQKNIIENENKGRIDFENPPESFINKKLKEIMTISDSKLGGYAELLKDYELQYLAYYLPKEKDLNINIKIKKVLMYRLSQNILDCYYMSWQNYFDAVPNNFNSQTLLDLSQNGEYSKIYNIKPQDIKAMIEKKPHLVLLSMISSYDSDFDIAMHDVYKIKNYTRLGKMIVRTRYLYCSSKELQKVSESFLCDVVNEYDKEERVLFFINFVTKIETGKLSNYLDLETIAERYLGPHTEQYEQLPPKIKTLLLAWFSVKKIFDIFGSDERGVFWRARALEYKAENAVLYNDFGLAVILFKNFVATDFLEINDGPMYILPKEEYEKVFLPLIYRYTNKSDLKSVLFHKYGESKYRIVHRGNWRSVATYTIINMMELF